MQARARIARKILPVGVGFALILTTARGVAAPEPQDAYRTLDLFARLLHLVESNYLEAVDAKKLVYGAIRGMLQTLDPHTAFLPPEMYREMKIDTTGEYGGLGLEVAVRQGALVVVSPIEGTPAHKAGLKTGDRIVAIDGKATRQMTLTDAVRAMQGPKGSKVTVTIERPGEPKPIDFVLVRDHIRIRSAEGSLLEPGYAYVRVKNFQDRTSRYLAETLRRLEKASQGPFKGVILDLRNNPGGLLEQAVQVSDFFLDGGVIVVTKGRGRSQVERRYATTKGVGFTKYPMVVLVNGGSASASEIVAGALQDHRRAVVLGTPTFGKGSVQTLMELEDAEGQKVGLKLTVAKYYTPSGRSIQEQGIHPDIVVQEGKVEAAKPSAGRREKDLERHFKGEPEPSPEPAVKPNASSALLGDLQVKTALDQLKAFDILGSPKPTARPEVEPGRPQKGSDLRGE
jgi:carboxyl-terminal processing protease